MTFLNNIVRVLEKYPMLFVEGTLMTLLLSAITVAVSTVFGSLMAMMRIIVTTQNPIRFITLRWIARANLSLH